MMGQGPSHLTKIPISNPSGSNSGAMNLSDFGIASDTIKLEHVFTFNIGEKWERPMRKVAESFARVGYHWAESFRIIATGLSCYFVLSGLAKLVAATKSMDDSSSSRTKSRTKSKPGGSSHERGVLSGKDAKATAVIKIDEDKDSATLETSEEPSLR